MGSWPGSPFGLEDEPVATGCFILEDLQTLHVSHKQETRGLDTTSFLSRKI